MAFVVSNKHLPCDPEYLFTARVFGVNGQYTNVTWDPPRYLGQPKIDVYIKGIAEWLERLTANADVSNVLGSITASSDTVESKGRQIKQR